ncbi:MAG: hypothetical protein K0R39_3679 [Symbiobacteriaceae bacterium]|jgi:uncharacterized membrane protein|nr:hypothetical protein [Symbiobacteriaceae bacterium]
MRFPAFPNWLQWLLLLAVIWLWIQVSMFQAAQTTRRLKMRFASRQDLETAYTKGNINRDEYEQLKGRFGG